MQSAQSPQEYFRLLLLTVVGGAYGAAGYTLEERPAQWSGGLFRFSKALENGLFGFIEYQLLAYSEGRPSRFRVTLIRSDHENPTVTSQHSNYARRLLSALVVEDFGVAILPSADHWWQYANVTELGAALAEAGHLVVGFGLPWLAGEISPE